MKLVAAIGHPGRAKCACRHTARWRHGGPAGMGALAPL